MAILPALIISLTVHAIICHSMGDVSPKPLVKSKPMNEYHIDLNLPIVEQYRQIMTDYADEVKRTHEIIFSNPTFKRFRIIYYFFQGLHSQEFRDYADAFAELTGFDPIDFAVSSLLDEFGCNSVLIQNSNGEVIMGRNFDYELINVFTNTAMKLHFYRGSEYIMTGNSLPGLIGILNTQKPGKFATSMNSRRYSSILSNAIRILRGYDSPTFAHFQHALKSESFEEIVHNLSRVKLDSQIYFTIAGVKKNEGVVIGRDPKAVANFHQLDVDDGKWFICQTNHDIGPEDPDGRRVPTEKLLEAAGQNLDYQGLLDKVMSLFPANHNMTVYTTIYSPRANYSNTSLWELN